MAVRNPFIMNIGGRLDLIPTPKCTDCIHFRGPVQWPDKEMVSYCAYKMRSLSIEFEPDGYLNLPLFCKEYTDLKGITDSATQKAFNSIRDELDPQKLYSPFGDRYLREYDFSELKEVD